MNKSGYVEFMITAAAESNWAKRERIRIAKPQVTTWRDLGEARP